MHAGKWQRAALDDANVALSGRMFHRHDELLGAGHQIHRAAHPFDHLARHRPIGQIPFAINLEGAKNRHVDEVATNHRE